MNARWRPGDPVHERPPAELPASEGIRRGGGRPMRWRADEAMPGPWAWLRGGSALLDLDAIGGVA